MADYSLLLTAYFSEEVPKVQLKQRPCPPHQAGLSISRMIAFEVYSATSASPSRGMKDWALAEKRQVTEGHEEE